MTTTMTTTTTTTTRLDAAGHDYVMTVYRQLTTMFGRRWPTDIAEELVQQECLQLAERLDDTMGRFPDPVMYAKVRATGRYALLGMVRTDQVQAGRGARGQRHIVDGDAHHRRPSDRPGGDAEVGTAYEVYARQHADDHDGVVEQLARIARLRSALAPLSPRARTLLYLVDGHGYTVTEAAMVLGIARETAARTRSAAYRQLSGAAA